jgi:hypothetical protein
MFVVAVLIGIVAGIATWGIRDAYRSNYRISHMFDAHYDLWPIQSKWYSGQLDTHEALRRSFDLIDRRAVEREAERASWGWRRRWVEAHLH